MHSCRPFIARPVKSLVKLTVSFHQILAAILTTTYVVVALPGLILHHLVAIAACILFLSGLLAVKHWYVNDSVRGSTQRQCSAWPSAKEKLQPRECRVVGRSYQVSPVAERKNQPSFKVAVLSSRKTMVAVGTGIL